MRGRTSTAAAIVVAAACGVGVVVGCSAEGGGAGTSEDPSPTDTGGAQLPPPSLEGDASTPPPPPKDGGKESGADAGPPPPTPGTACPTVNETKTKSCGKCGKATTICLASGSADAGDAGGGGAWSEYGPCENEVGVCTPGETQACGNCGKATCTQYCAWSACGGQPTGSCVPGAVDLSTAGCAAPDTYRQRTCQATCQYDNFSASCSAPPTTIEVPPTVGSTNSTIVILSAAAMIAKTTGTCPSATVSTTVSTPGAWIKVHNPNAKAATVTIYNSAAPGGPSTLPTLLASYAGANPPATATAQKACVKGVSSFSDDTLTGDFDFAALTGIDAVTVPANGTITVYDAAQTKTSTGKVKLSVQLDRLAP
jgi:hypothetical protein